MYYERQQRTFVFSWVVREFSLPTYHGLMYHVIVKNTFVLLGGPGVYCIPTSKFFFYIMYYVAETNVFLFLGG